MTTSISNLNIKYLSENDFLAVKIYLGKFSAKGLKDTVIIKYDFAKTSCWSSLDDESSEYIQKVIEGNNKYVSNMSAVRPGISIFQFRESGTHFNKLKLWNKEIIIDSERFLENLFFTKHKACGSSVIIMPDRKCIIIPSDPHFEALTLSIEKVKGL